MGTLKIIWVFVQVLVGYNLVLPLVLYLIWILLPKRKLLAREYADLPDYAIVVTAYQFAETLPAVIGSILKLKYGNYHVYVVGDNCKADELSFGSESVTVLIPPEVLASNTRSHHYAMNHFLRNHDRITIIDSDNLVDPDYLIRLNTSFDDGFHAVQGLRAAKNLDGTIACLDAARDIYYHFYDGRLLFECGSSATLSGSGMAFESSLYQEFLASHDIKGAGFDKVLQSWLVMKNIRIAFNEKAIVFDEKTSRPDQLVKQRSRWINTWFKYFRFGFEILFRGLTRSNRNQTLFGLILLRPPLFIFLIISAVCFAINLLIGDIWTAMAWCTAVLIFIVSFFIALLSSNTDPRIYRSLKDVPKFVAYQVISLFKSGNANKISVSTQHYYGPRLNDKNN